MNLVRKHTIASFLLALVLTCTMVSQAHAAMNASGGFSATEDGFSLNYDIPIIGKANVNLRDEGDSDTLSIKVLFINIATITLTHGGIQSDPTDAFILGFSIDSQFFDALEGSLPIPFGGIDLGASINLFGKVFKPTIGDHHIDFSVLLARNRARYDVTINLPELGIDFSDEGEAENNEISIQFEELLDILLTLDPGRFLTSIAWNIEVTLPPIPTFPGQEDVELPEIPPVVGGPVPIPNGSYRVWLDLNYDLSALGGVPLF